MRIKVKRKTVNMRDKVTISYFFKMQIQIIRELYKKNSLFTIGILLFSGILMCTSFVELKLLEFVTNGVSDYLKGSDGNFSEFLFYISIFLGTLFLMKIASNIYDVISERYKSEIMFNVEKNIMNKLSSISYEYYEASEFYEKIKLASQASEQYPNAVYGVTQITKIIIMVIVYGNMLSRINMIFVFMIFLSVLISTVIAMNVTDKQVDYWRTNVSPHTRRNIYFRDMFVSRVNQQNIQTSRSYSFFGEKYSFYNNNERVSYMKLNIISFATEISTSLMFIMAFLFTAIYVGNGVVSGKYEIGYYSMVIALLLSLFSVIKQFTIFIINNNWYIKVLDAYYDIMALEESHFSNDDRTKNSIQINDLYYKYPQSEECALKGINITINRGEKIAVVGYNGSGKTTLVSVILGLLHNYKGYCSCNSIKCAAVLQDFAQYQMSIKENIEIGCGGQALDENVISNILKDVGLYDFVSSLNEGIYTKLGQLDNGIELSKGQWQRLAIARLLANKDANVWILDEPTAYLDPIAEIEMYQLIYNLAKDRLVFFISHRLGFAKNADRILVVNDGKIVENGNHRELRENKGLYSEMFDIQRSWYE